jgi:acetyl esterase/lipase
METLKRGVCKPQIPLSVHPKRLITFLMKLIASLILLCTLSLRAEFKPDIEYGKAGDTSLRLDASVPFGVGPFPVVLLVHGGGWAGGDKKDMKLFSEPLVASNFVTFSINYRLAPTNRWPACFEDTQTAIQWVKAHAADYKGDPKHVALIGYSAGGQLVCLAGVLAKEDTRVQAVVGCAAPTDMVADTQRRGGLSKSAQALLDRPEKLDAESEQILHKLSALDFVKPGLPPFYLVHGTEDQSVPYKQSIAFQAKLRTNSVPCELVTVSGATHRINEWAKTDPTWKEKMIGWLGKELKR